MPVQIDTAFGECATHGRVEAERYLPKITFPPLITAVRRALAKSRVPYTCPQCGSAVRPESP